MRTYEESNEDRLLSVAASVVFFGLLAIFPALAAFVSLYGLFADPATVREHIAGLSGVLPPSALEIIVNQTDSLATRGGSGLGFAFLLGLALALWSAMSGVKALFDALNVIYEEQEKRGFLALNAVALTFTLGILLFMLLAIGAVVVFPVVLGYFGLSAFAETLTSLLRWPVFFCVVVALLALVYRYGPSRNRADWRWVSVGSVVAAALWIAGSAAFSYYLANFASYNETYGSLGAAVGLMTWLWLSAIAVLVGAEINAEIEHQTAFDTTGRNLPLGRRGAAMADSVGSAR